MPDDIILTPEELDALIDKVIDKRDKQKKPKPWDGATERRLNERRKLIEQKQKYRKIGGLISAKE